MMAIPNTKTRHKQYLRFKFTKSPREIRRVVQRQVEEEPRLKRRGGWGAADGQMSFLLVNIMSRDPRGWRLSDTAAERQSEIHRETNTEHSRGGKRWSVTTA